MNKRFSTSLQTISRMIPLTLYPRIMPRDVIDFFWHAVSDEPMPHVSHLYPVVSNSVFEASLLYLKNNFTFINYVNLHSHIFEGTALPPKAVHISFDDGYAECYNIVRPLLLKHGIPCTFFLTTNLIDNNILFYRNKQSLCIEQMTNPTFNFQPSIFDHFPSSYQFPLSSLNEFISWFKDLRLQDEPVIDEICRIFEVDTSAFLDDKQPYLTTAQIHQMHTEGFTMGAHTLTHRKLVDLADNAIETEIAQSCQVVGDITGQNIVPFSFPHSAWGLDREHLAEIRTRHPAIGLLFDTKGLRKDADFIHNRIWAERSLSNLNEMEHESQRIKEQLYFAYQEAWTDELIEKGRTLARPVRR